MKEYLLGDIISGISTGVMQLPQGEYLSGFIYPPLCFFCVRFYGSAWIPEHVLMRIGCVFQVCVSRSVQHSGEQPIMMIPLKLQVSDMEQTLTEACLSDQYQQLLVTEQLFTV